MTVCYLTGAIGTPIHELSHALFCLIFAHKITEIKLFQINSADGTLGYVNHSYNKKNIYQRVGNFFIGIAPIIVITALLGLIAWALMPNVIYKMSAQIGAVSLSNGFEFVFGAYFGAMGIFFEAITDYHWWLFILIGSCFALHMNLSKEDINGALVGLIFVLAIFLIADIILFIIGIPVLNGFTRIILRGGVFLSVFLSISLIVNLVLLGISFIYRAVARRIGRR